MRRSPRNLPARCTRSPSTPRRQEKLDARRDRGPQWPGAPDDDSNVKRQDSTGSKCRAGAFRPRLLDVAVARHRDNAERRDPVALTAEHAKAEAVEREALAPVGDRARLVNHEAG